MSPLLRVLLMWLFQFLSASAAAERDRDLEIAALRQQIALLKRQVPRPQIRTCDRLFWIALRALWPRWKHALVVVKPATVVAWHRAAFRSYWRWRSRPRGRPRTAAELRALIRTMATENRWGAPRIHGELLKLGFRIAERTVSRYLRAVKPRGAHRRGGWKAFLENHREGIAAMDFFTVPTATFRVLYVLVVIEHDRRRILHVNVTEHPTAAWVCQQLREALPGDVPMPRYLLCDQDSIFSEQVTQTSDAIGVKLTRTAYRSPWQNGTCERVVGTLRRELLNHVIVLNDTHLRRLLGSYIEGYYHSDRTHLGLGKDTPCSRAVTPRPSATATVASRPRVGGLHHRYQWDEAA